jgi:FSR family fosmidomycin resistance protein-like MFS transporter
MFKQTRLTLVRLFSLRGAIPLTFIFLLVVFYDEFVYAVGYSALPSIRADLGLTYAQVGLLLGLPGIINTFIEPVLMLLGDTPLRKVLILGGGVGMALTALLIAGAQALPLLLLAEILSFPSSGAFVTLSQATLMDLNPGREGPMMARWSLSGSLANLIAPLLVAGGFALGWGWRWAYLCLGVWGAVLVWVVGRRTFPPHPLADSHQTMGVFGVLRELLRGLWDTLRNVKLLRWIILLDLSDLLLDIFTGYAALYFADVAGLGEAQVALVLSLMMLASLASDVFIIPLLEKFNGRAIVRLSAVVVIPLYAAFLLVPWPSAKIVLVLLVKLCTLGWYSVMEGEAFAAAPGRSGTVKAIGSLSGLFVGALIGFLGWFAETAGLPTMMWLLLAGPLALALFVPRPVVE